MRNWHLKGDFHPVVLVRQAEWEFGKLYTIESLWDDEADYFRIPPHETAGLDEINATEWFYQESKSDETEEHGNETEEHGNETDERTIQGPFKFLKMREWHSKGVFRPSTLVRKSEWTQMHRLASLWKSPADYFRTPPNPPAEGDAAADSGAETQGAAGETGPISEAEEPAAEEYNPLVVTLTLEHGQAGIMIEPIEPPDHMRSGGDQSTTNKSIKQQPEPQPIAIKSVKPGSWGEQQDLKPGNKILKMNGRRFEEFESTFDVLNTLQRIRPLEFVVLKSEMEFSATQLREIRKKEEKRLNEQIQNFLCGLRPSIVNLLLINESELLPRDQKRLNCEFKKENSGVVGVGFEEDNKRVIYVHLSPAEDETGHLYDENTLSSTKTTRVLVGSEAYEAYVEDARNAEAESNAHDDRESQSSAQQRQQLTSSQHQQHQPQPAQIPTRILNTKMLAKLQEALKHELTWQSAYSLMDHKQDLMLEEIQLNGWDSVQFPQGFTLLHWAAKQGNLDLMKFLIAECGAVGSVDDYGWKPREYARKYNKDKKILNWLIDEFDQIVKPGVKWNQWGSSLEDFLVVGDSLVGEPGEPGSAGFGMTESDYWFMSRGGVDPKVLALNATYHKFGEATLTLEDGGTDRLSGRKKEGDQELSGDKELSGAQMIINKSQTYQQHAELSTDVDPTLIRLRQQQELEMNRGILNQLAGLRPSLVELLLVKQTALSKTHVEKLRDEFKREKAGVFGLSARETYRVVFVWLGAHSVDEDGLEHGREKGGSDEKEGDEKDSNEKDNNGKDNNDIVKTSAPDEAGNKGEIKTQSEKVNNEEVNNGSSILSSADKKTRILIGSAAVRQFRQTGDSVKILNIKLFDKLMGMLNHGFDINDDGRNHNDGGKNLAAKNDGKNLAAKRSVEDSNADSQISISAAEAITDYDTHYPEMLDRVFKHVKENYQRFSEKLGDSAHFEENLRLAIKRGWDNANWEQGITLLHAAARNDDLNLVKFLIRHCGAAPWAPDATNQKLTPTAYAKKMKKRGVEIVDFYEDELEFFVEETAQIAQKRCSLHDLELVVKDDSVFKPFGTSIEQGNPELDVGYHIKQRNQQYFLQWIESHGGRKRSLRWLGGVKEAEEGEKWEGKEEEKEPEEKEQEITEEKEPKSSPISGCVLGVNTDLPEDADLIQIPKRPTKKSEIKEQTKPPTPKAVTFEKQLEGTLEDSREPSGFLGHINVIQTRQYVPVDQFEDVINTALELRDDPKLVDILAKNDWSLKGRDEGRDGGGNKFSAGGGNYNNTGGGNKFNTRGGNKFNTDSEDRDSEYGDVALSPELKEVQTVESGFLQKSLQSMQNARTKIALVFCTKRPPDISWKVIEPQGEWDDEKEILTEADIQDYTSEIAEKLHKLQPNGEVETSFKQHLMESVHQASPSGGRHHHSNHHHHSKTHEGEVDPQIPVDPYGQQSESVANAFAKSSNRRLSPIFYPNLLPIVDLSSFLPDGRDLDDHHNWDSHVYDSMEQRVRAGARFSQHRNLCERISEAEKGANLEAEEEEDLKGETAKQNSAGLLEVGDFGVGDFGPGNGAVGKYERSNDSNANGSGKLGNANGSSAKKYEPAPVTDMHSGSCVDPTMFHTQEWLATKWALTNIHETLI